MHETIAECALVWIDTHDAELTRQAHERHCVPLDRARAAAVDTLLRESANRLDAEAALVLGRS